MDVKVTQCPSCGSPVEAPKTGMLLECHYCGSTLHIVRSASGAPLAELADIKVDTALLAREHARARLWERIEKMGEQIQDVASELDSRRSDYDARALRPGCYTGLLAGIGGGLLVGYVDANPTAGLVGGMMIGIATGLVVLLALASRLSSSPAVQAAEKRLESLRAERDALTRRLCEIEQELDELTERL